ncbi:MAG: DUF1501 domain-containing protein, partial [Acidobacteria bacterium]|nr:DUF1501 domain-containing protein [Acidobacteriota bacterium]
MDRREIIKFGGLAMAGALAGRVVWPLEVKGAAKANPRNTARNCILIEMGGAISQMDCWDFKETHWTPKDLDVRKVNSELYLSKMLFPTLDAEMHRCTLLRSMRAPELVHFNGQYHTQAGRALNVAVAKEIPAFGSIIAYELDSRRKETDTFPAYVSTGLTKSRVGALGSGFLPTKFTGLDLDPQTVFDTFGGNREGMIQTIERRWRFLSAMSEASTSEKAAMGSKATDYRSFYEEAYELLNDERWASAFAATQEERDRYGNDEYGLGLILARNLIQKNAGTHFVYVYDGDRWDHHSYIFDRSKPSNHYVTCLRLDKGLTSLLQDLSKTPGVDPGKTLLDETLIVATSEFGRTPDMNPVKGRDHWRFVYTSLFAGGGVK